MKWAAWLVALLIVPVALTPTASAEPDREDAGYFPTLLLFGYSCSAEEHSLIPTEPTDPSLDEPVGWALSGEPECAHADALNKKRGIEGEERIQWGIGWLWFKYTTEDTGSLATARASDALFGDDAGFLGVFARGEEGYVSSEGCGTQSIVLPEPTSPWQSAPSPEWAPWWTSIDGVGVEEDLTTCFATSGIVHATWGT